MKRIISHVWTYLVGGSAFLQFRDGDIGTSHSKKIGGPYLIAHHAKISITNLFDVTDVKSTHTPTQHSSLRDRERLRNSTVYR